MEGGVMSTPMIERTSHAPSDVTRRTTPMWMTLLGELLLLLALGFAGGALTMQAVDEEPAGLADESVVAISRATSPRATPTTRPHSPRRTRPNARAFVYDGHIELARFEFADVIARELGGTTTLTLTSEVVQNGAHAPASYSEGGTEGLVVMEIVGGKVSSQYIFIDRYK